MTALRYVTCGLITAAVLTGGCEKTTVQGESGKKLTIVKPMDSSVKRGDSEKVAVVIARTNFTGPVAVRFTNLPRGVKVVDTIREIEGTEHTFVLSADPDADLVKNHTVDVTVTGPDGMSASEQFQVTVKEKS